MLESSLFSHGAHAAATNPPRQTFFLQHFLLAGGAAKLCENCVSRVAEGLKMDLAAARHLCLAAGGCFRKFEKLV